MGEDLRMEKKKEISQLYLLGLEEDAVSSKFTVIKCAVLPEPS